MVSPSLPVSAAFLAIVASLVAFAAVAVRGASAADGVEPARARRQSAVSVLVVVGWLALGAAIAASGWILDFESRPPRMAFLLAPAVLACILIAVLPVGARLARGVPAWLLVGYQAFRIPMEIVLHQLHREGVIPVQMTWEGRNLDVLTGLLAIPVAWLAFRKRLPAWLLLAWNLAGLALLVNIVIVAILSMPYSFRAFAEGPANEVVFHWPFVWLPAFVVPMALLGHLVVARGLVGTWRGRRPAVAR